MCVASDFSSMSLQRPYHMGDHGEEMNGWVYQRGDRPKTKNAEGVQICFGDMS